MTHDDTTLQAAIDAAFQTNGEKYCGNLVTHNDHYAWSREDSARLAVAKAFLAALPPAEQSAFEQPAPDERSLGQVAFEAFGYTHIWDASMRKGDWQRAAQAVVEAVRGKQVAEIEQLEEKLTQIKKHLVEANRGAQQNAHVNQSLAAKLNEALKSVEKAEFERGICEDNAMKLQTELAEAKATIEALKQAQPWQPAVGDVVRLIAEQNSSGVRFSEQEMRIMDIALRIQQEYEQLFLEVKDLKKQLTNLKTQKP